MAELSVCTPRGTGQYSGCDNSLQLAARVLPALKRRYSQQKLEGLFRILELFIGCCRQLVAFVAVDRSHRREVGAFSWTVLAPDIVNPGREEQGSFSM